MKKLKLSLTALALTVGIVGVFAFKQKPSTSNYDWYDTSGNLIEANGPVSDVCDETLSPICAYGFTPVSNPPATHSLSNPQFTATGVRQ